MTGLASRCTGPLFGTLALLAAAVVTLATATPVAATEAPNAGPGVLLAAAEGRLAAGDAVGAEGIYRRLVAEHPALADAYQGLARALAAQGRNDEAAALHQRLGEGWLDAGEYGLARGELEAAVALAPGSPRGHALLGRALLLSQSFARGGEHLARAVELGERSLPTRLYLASALWENGQLAEAEALLGELAAGGAFAARHQLGRLLLWQGRWNEAVAVLSSLGGAGVDVELDLARALEGAGREGEALALYRRVVAREPEGSAARYRLALLLARGGHATEAAEQMESFTRLYREEQEAVRRTGLERARLDRGWELLAAGRPAAALERFATLPETADVLRGAALALAALGRHAEAVATLERAVVLAPERGDLKLLLADQRLTLERAP